MSKNTVNIKQLIETGLTKRTAITFSSIIDLVLKNIFASRPELAVESKRAEIRDKIVSCIEVMEREGELLSYDIFEGDAYVDSVYMLSKNRLELPVTPVSIQAPAQAECSHEHRGDPELFAYVWRDTASNSLVATVSEQAMPVTKLYADTPTNVEAGLFAMYPVDIRVHIKEAEYSLSSTTRQQESAPCQAPTTETKPQQTTQENPSN